MLWTEGLFLQPHHFQQSDRYAEALVSGLACAYVHRQRKALHGEGERMPEGGAGGGAGGGHDLEQQSPGLKGKTVEVRFARGPR